MSNNQTPTYTPCSSIDLSEPITVGYHAFIQLPIVTTCSLNENI